MTSNTKTSHDGLWRVSVATYNRVIFPDPQTGTRMLALERKATADGENVRVRAQPFGGGVRILHSSRLQELVGKIEYDSERSQAERDFRILIPSTRWETVKRYCLDRLKAPDDIELESIPDRELGEEFIENLQVDLKPEQYTLQPVGFVIEDNPVPTENASARGQLTVRIYRIFEVQVTDPALGSIILAASQTYSDHDLAQLALRDLQKGGRGRANSVLTLPLASVKESYFALPPDERFRKITVDGHELDESVLAILSDIDVPQYQRT